jgi:hypothetical protein
MAGVIGSVLPDIDLERAVPSRLLSTSASMADGTVAITPPVAGSVTSMRSPDRASCHSPPMSMRRVEARKREVASLMAAGVGLRVMESLVHGMDAGAPGRVAARSRRSASSPSADYHGASCLELTCASRLSPWF